MPHCQNCAAFVTQNYVDVFAKDDEVYCCPQCPDTVRGSDGRPRAARSSRGPQYTDVEDADD